MERKPLKSLVREVLETSGCLVEEDRERLEVVLSQDVATTLGLKEHQYLYFSPDKRSDDGIFVSYDSTILEHISQLVAGRGLFYQVNLANLYLKQEGLHEAISRKVTFPNSIYRLKSKGKMIVSYLVFNFCYSAISERKMEGLIPVIVNEVTLSTPMGILKYPESSSGYHEESEETGEVARRPVEEVYQIASQVARQEVKKALVDFKRSLEWRLNRDITRLQEYYGTLKEESQSRIEKKGLTGEEKERELSKIRAIDLELRRKIKEQQDRYAIRVEVELATALRLTLPVRSVVLRVRRKEKERDFTLLWNPLLKEIELPVCEACLNTIEEIYFCDEKLHQLCRQCYECPLCYKRVCRACYAKICPRCHAPFPLNPETSSGLEL